MFLSKDYMPINKNQLSIKDIPPQVSPDPPFN